MQCSKLVGLEHTDHRHRRLQYHATQQSRSRYNLGHCRSTTEQLTEPILFNSRDQPTDSCYARYGTQHSFSASLNAIPRTRLLSIFRFVSSIRSFLLLRFTTRRNNRCSTGSVTRLLFVFSLGFVFPFVDQLGDFSVDVLRGDLNWIFIQRIDQLSVDSWWHRLHDVEEVILRFVRQFVVEFVDGYTGRGELVHGAQPSEEHWLKAQFEPTGHPHDCFMVISIDAQNLKDLDRISAFDVQPWFSTFLREGLQVGFEFEDLQLVAGGVDTVLHQTQFTEVSAYFA
ncbi:hypothetical protein D3C87_1301200 [compost metagenome]